MVYKYCENRNFEDLASGRVLLHRTGYPNFPVRLARENLSLLHRDGLARRTEQLERLWALHHKSSHQGALESAERLGRTLADQARAIECRVFQRDIFAPRPPEGPGFRADIIFTDVPYGNLVEWQSREEDGVNFLDRLLPVVRAGSVVAICSDKSQRFRSQYFQRVEKQTVGKRMFQIFKPQGNP